MPEKSKEDLTLKKSDNEYLATVYAWGVKPGKSKLGHQIGVKLFGGNVGHASMAVCFPADERGEQLIAKYCAKKSYDSMGLTEIPYKRITKEYISENGVSIEKDYYEVYFSVRPLPINTNMMFLQPSIIGDKLAGRLGESYDYRRNVYPEYNRLKIEHRKTKGWLSKKNITLPPLLYSAIKRTATANDDLHQIIKLALIRLERIEQEMIKTNNEIYQFKLQLKKDQTAKLSKKIKDIQNKNIENIIKDKKERLAELRKNIKRICEEYYDAYSIDLDQYIKIGKSPSGIVSLPVIDGGNPEHENKTGLSLENMLKAMRDIVDQQEEKFDLYKKNCSSTTLTVLNAGIRESDRKWLSKHVPKVEKYLEKGAWFFKMLTPQSVYNAAASMDKRFMRKRSIIEPIKGLIKPSPIKEFFKYLNKLKKMFIDRNIQLAQATIKDVFQSKSLCHPLMFSKNDCKENAQQQETKIAKWEKSILKVKRRK